MYPDRIREEIRKTTYINKTKEKKKELRQYSTDMIFYDIETTTGLGISM